MATGTPDGLFSWAAWPWGNTDMNTWGDETYTQVLGDKEYMMPVSPWFYTNIPAFNKNWLWPSEDLWWDRWQDVLALRPPFVQIISWNDYGEATYIGPVQPGPQEIFELAKSKYNYAPVSMAHDGWRMLLPF